jgi:DNA-binding NarL/FixJ family response regulator
MKSRRSTAARAGRPDLAAPPALLRSDRFIVAGQEYLVLSWPIVAHPSDGLTDAERLVLSEILAGRSNRSIAERRNVSVHTVANQVASILRKLCARSRFELMGRFSRG